MSATPESMPRESWSYSGEVWTDAHGLAVVVLPPFVRAHRAGFDYELTTLGAAAPARVADEVADDRFTIATDEPHVKVAWRVTALREPSPAPRDATEQSAITTDVSPGSQEVEG
jgi:hypothetical protein